MRATFFKGTVLGAVVGSLTLVSTVAVAGTGVGGIFNLGQSNSVNATTTLTGATSGKQLQVTNSSTGVGAAGIGIKVAAGKPPLVVNSSTKVAGLNADKVDGLDATAFQRPLNSTCQNNTAVSAVTSSGAVTCSRSAVRPIALDLASGQLPVGASLGPSSLRLYLVCPSTGGHVTFENGANSTGATLNWMFSEGGTSSTVNASGVSLAAGDQIDFSPPTGRLEGQWIFAEPAGVTTVNLHFFTNGSFCEARGTAEVALLP